MKQRFTFILAFAIDCDLSGQTAPSIQKNSKQYKNRAEEKKQKRTAVAYDVADIVLAKKIIIHMESALLSQPIIPVPLSGDYASLKLMDNHITCALPKISTYQIAKFMYGTSPGGIPDKYTIYASDLPADEMKCIL